MLNVPESDIYYLVDSYIKIYPTKSILIKYKAPRLTRIPGYEIQQQPGTTNQLRSNSSTSADSIRRSKTTISDIVLSNRFNLFCTFTFNPRKVNRTDPTECKKVMSQWLHNQTKTYGKFDYIIIPEFHKDGKSLHFHALFNNYNGKLTPTKFIHATRKVYNIKSFKSGFSTAIQIDNNLDKVSSYIKKYITKDMPLFPGKKRFWVSQNLQRPKVIPNPILDLTTKSSFVLKYNTPDLDILESTATIKLLTNQE